ncbi:MAG: YgiT-type zinc finger protein [Chloroflexi bacterium]|nr:YgiT-type zinc finger protein [Chloroflexota bacterium]
MSKPEFPTKCPLCGAPVKVHRQEIVVRGGTHAAVFEDWVGECTRCGEVLFTPETVEREFALRRQLEAGRFDGLRPVGKLFVAEAV